MVIKPTKPHLFSTDWWNDRKAVLESIEASQAGLRRAQRLPGDADPHLQRLIVQRSEAATQLALYGDDPRRNDGRELRADFVTAASRLDDYQRAQLQAQER